MFLFTDIVHKASYELVCNGEESVGAFSLLAKLGRR